MAGTVKELQPQYGIRNQLIKHIETIYSESIYKCIRYDWKEGLNQRTSGPVNAHRTPGPLIYFNAFIHVHSPRVGAGNPLGINVDVNRKPLSPYPFVASFKTISTRFFHVFPHVYSPWQGQTNPWGQNFQQKGLILLIICCKFWKKPFELWSYTKFWPKQKDFITLTICCKFKKKISFNSDFIHIFACRGGSWTGIVIPSSLVPVLNHGSRCWAMT